MGSIPNCKYKEICYKNNNISKNDAIVHFSNRIDIKDSETNEDNKNMIVFIDPYKPNNNYFYKIQNIIKIQRAYRKYNLSQQKKLNTKIKEIFSPLHLKNRNLNDNKLNENFSFFQLNKSLFYNKNQKINPFKLSYVVKKINNLSDNNLIFNINHKNNSNEKNNNNNNQINKKNENIYIMNKTTNKSKDKKYNENIIKSKKSHKIKKNSSLTNEYTLSNKINLSSLKKGSIRLSFPFENNSIEHSLESINNKSLKNECKLEINNSFTSSISSSSSISLIPNTKRTNTDNMNNVKNNYFLKNFFSLNKTEGENKIEHLNTVQSIWMEDIIFGCFLKKSDINIEIKVEKENSKNEKNGFGIIKWEDNSKLYGEFKHNKITGICKFINKKDNSIFKGEYENNYPYGYGIFEMNNCSYEGVWVKNNIIDIGIEMWNDQTFFQGEFSKLKRNGIGIYRWPDGTIYQGEWENNKMNGYGTIMYSDERIYTGEFKNGLMDGLGIFSWRNGNKYIGHYYRDLKCGFGTFIWMNKPLLAFIGFWEKGKQNGVGALINGNMVKYGLWKNGKKEMWLKGSWEIRKYIKNHQYTYEKILSKNVIKYIKAINVN